MHDGMPYVRNQGQGHSREVDRQSPTRLIFIITFYFLSIEGPRERTEYIDIFLFAVELNHVLFLMFCLLVEGECQILVF